jgi:hypothetical protein
MRPQLNALAETVRQRKCPLPGGDSGLYENLRMEIRRDVLDMPASDVNEIIEFCTGFIDAVSAVQKGTE